MHSSKVGVATAIAPTTHALQFVAIAHILQGMIPRTIARAVTESRSGFPASLIVGPRQSGKTVLAREVYSDLAYVNFESPLERAEFRADPVGYLARMPDGAILDEVQNVPELLSYLQVRIDEERAMGRWALTGSYQLGLMGTVQQSLAGRVAQFELHPFSMEELSAVESRPRSFLQAILQGGFPALYDRNRDIPDGASWLENYIATFVNRDIQSLLELRESRAFDLFLKRCAGLSGQQVNKSTLAQNCDVDRRVVDAWLEALEIGFLVRVIRPFHRNFGKRLSKQPKLYFLDSGVACRLLGIATLDHLVSHPLIGALAETWFFGEIQRFLAGRRRLESVYFWRTSDGHEVDFIIEVGSRIIPIEAKFSGTSSSDLSRGIRALEEVGKRENAEITKGLVVYGGSELVERASAVFVPWDRVAEGLEIVM